MYNEIKMCDRKEIVDVSIIIVSYNHLEVLRGTLAGIIQYFTTPNIEIILVDNASLEPVLETIQKEYPQVHVVANKYNLGFGSGNNIGAKKAKGEYLLFANSDLILKGNPLPDMIQIFKNNLEIGIVGCQLWNEDGTQQPSFFRFPSLSLRFLQVVGIKDLLLWIFPKIRFKDYHNAQLDFVSGAFFMIHRSMFNKINGFDERYFMYIEDADFGYRVALEGKKSILFYSKDIIHLGANYEEVDNRFVLYNMNRGLLLFYSKYYSRLKSFLFSTMSIFFFMLKYALFIHDKSIRKNIAKILSLYWNYIRCGSIKN
jgi:GT2 family glycosyltransferase